MEKFQVDPDNDITQEPYKGPSAVVSAIGNGFFKHLLWAGIGLAAGAGAAAFFPKQVASILKEWRAGAAAAKLETAEGFWPNVKKELAKFAHAALGEGKGAVSITTTDAAHKDWVDVEIMNKEHGIGHWLVTHLFLGLIPVVGKMGKKGLVEAAKTAEEAAGGRFTNMLTIGGILGAAGYAAGTAAGMLEGAKHGHEGKRQHERAKVEIQDLRERNQDLEKVNDKLHLDYQNALSRINQIRAEAEKTTPKFGPESAPAPTGEQTVENLASEHAAHHDHAEHAQHAHAAAPHASVAANDAEHHGKMHAHHAHALEGAGVA